MPGEFLFAVKIRQYDTAEERWKNVGHVYRDVQIIVSESPGAQGVLQDNVAGYQNIVEVPENNSTYLRVFVYPRTGEEIGFTLKTELAEAFYVFDVYDSIHENQDIVVGVLRLTHDPPMARLLPYIISVRASYTDPLNDTYFKDTNFAFATREFDPAFSPINGNEANQQSFFLSPNPVRSFVRVSHPTAVPLILAFYYSIGS